MDFSIANSIQFTIVNKKTLNLELEFDNQVFVEIIEFQVNITLRKCGIQQDYQYYRFLKNLDTKEPIEIILGISIKDGFLWFEFS